MLRPALITKDPLTPPQAPPLKDRTAFFTAKLGTKPWHTRTHGAQASKPQPLPGPRCHLKGWQSGNNNFPKGRSTQTQWGVPQASRTRKAGPDQTSR
jgi:hypothetical protein